jgi:hypothetical protein
MGVRRREREREREGEDERERERERERAREREREREREAPRLTGRPTARQSSAARPSEQAISRPHILSAHDRL